MEDIEKTGILGRINSPDDLKKLSAAEKKILAGEIREELLNVISKNGGHLAPNMGVVELTIALHSVFNTPHDKLVWDVGHQGYVHKLLTGRRDFFKTLRQDDGCCGFLSRDESEYDVFGAGHAGTAISAALGIAAARDRKNGTEKVIAIVGDGSINCGISLEGLNNISETTQNLIIILNDNKMSISPNVGAVAKYLNRIITGRGYNKFKAFLRRIVERIPRIGGRITYRIARLEEATKSILVPGVLFEELGLRYIGPVDGHDIEELIRVINVVKEFNKPVIVHVFTEKGHGYEPAAAEPERFHGLSAFDPDTGENPGTADKMTFSKAFGKAVCELAEKYENVAVITPAMASGTGLSEFANRFPDRFFDVGIAEEHAVVFAAGMAIEGFKPVVAMYATFLQRALDYVIHDVCLQNIPIIICADRAGIVEDGPTHHGIHDLSFLRALPNLSVVYPSDGNELRKMLFAAYGHKGPVVIRYPKAVLPEPSRTRSKDEIKWGKAEMLREGKDIAIWALGNECATAFEIAEILEKSGLSAAVVNARFIKPFDSGLLLNCAEKMRIVTIEDSQIQGGLATTVDECLVNVRHHGVMHFGWSDQIIPHGTIPGIRRKFGLTAGKIAEDILNRNFKF